MFSYVKNYDEYVELTNIIVKGYEKYGKHANEKITKEFVVVNYKMLKIANKQDCFKYFKKIHIYVKCLILKYSYFRLGGVKGGKLCQK